MLRDDLRNCSIVVIVAFNYTVISGFVSMLLQSKENVKNSSI